MKRKPKLKLEIVDAFNAEAAAMLTAAVEGLDPHSDFWRDEARERLLKAGSGKGLIVHVGGHHIAAHLPGLHDKPAQYGPCLGRVIEAAA